MSGSIASVARDPDELCVPTSLRRPSDDGQAPSGEADREGLTVQAEASPGTQSGSAVVALGDDIATHPARSQIGRNCRTDDPARCGAVPQDRNPRGAHLGPGAK